MDLKIDLLDLARAKSDHASARQAVLARNVANADTPGFKALDLPEFSEAMRNGDGDGLALRTSRSGHISDDGGGYRFQPEVVAPMGAESPNGNTVSLEDQMMRSVDNQHDHTMALNVYRKTLDVLRMTLGNR